MPNSLRYHVTILLLLVASVGLSQENFKKDTVLSIVRAYCLDDSQTDTLIIKEGMKTDLDTFHSYLYIIKRDSSYHFQHFSHLLTSNEELSGKSLHQGHDLVISKDDFLFLVESELLNCRFSKNKVDHRWSYQILGDTAQKQIFLDAFGYSLFQLFMNIKKPVPFEEHFCTSGLKWIKRTEVIEDFLYEKTRYDTIITEKLICANGNFGFRTIVDTRRKNTNLVYVLTEVTIDSSATKVTKACLLDNSETSYHKLVIGKKFSKSIGYNSDWKATYVDIYRNPRNNSKDLISSLHLVVGLPQLGPDYYEYKSFHFLGLFHRRKGFKGGEALYVTNQIFGRVIRYYEYPEGRRRLSSKTITRKKKVITKDYTWHGGVESVTIQTFIENNKPKEILTYKEDKLVDRITYFYEEETGEPAKKRRNDFF